MKNIKNFTARKLLCGSRLIFFLVVIFLSAPVYSQEVLRGEVMVELEPVYGAYVDEKYPLDRDDAYKRALEEAAMFFSASIYGWSFDYEIGEKARNMAEVFELNPLGEIPWGDSGLKVTQADIRDMRLRAWMDFRPDANQLRRIQTWKTGTIRTAQAVGYGPLGLPDQVSDWLKIKKLAMEDAARAAVRAMLQGSERNRPKEARGYISLQAFPVYWLDAGRWACSARFYVEIREIVPFSAY
ncbi:MAG: hypothetical protein FWD78_05435 [Treponema sp.]|nr:hypothetical protein [Treponema sp.]